VKDCHETGGGCHLCEEARQISGRVPICEQGQKCFPGVLPENLDAWSVWQAASISEWGITPEGIEATCRMLGIDDPGEVLIKIGEIVRIMRAKAAVTEDAGSDD
jgi:hypothetical protein